MAIHRVAFVTIVPSPYQRDLLGALAEREDVNLEVIYLESASPDSPWPEEPLRPFERVVPGFWVSVANARLHMNWGLPDMRRNDLVVLSSLSSVTGQDLMRRKLRGRSWLFWGERLREQPRGWRRRVQRALAAPLARASGIVGIGRAAAEDYARRFPALPSFCIPYHCDLRAFLAIDRRARRDEPFTFLFCGQMIERKGVDVLLRAFERLVAKGLDARLLLVGREADLQRFLVGMSAAARERVTYGGFRPPAELPCHFAEADAFVLPSQHDGWGVVVNQALGAGLPVITSDAVGAGMDLVESGVNGFRFPAGDVDALEDRMTRLATSQALARDLGEASRKIALDLTPAAGAEKWLHVIRYLTEGSRHT